MAKHKQTHIERINPSYANSGYLDNVIVVICAKRPSDNKMVGVGCYENATVYRNVISFSKGKNKKWMNFKCKIKDAHLILEAKRTFEIPRSSKDGLGFGQCNYWYADSDNCYDFRIKTLKYLGKTK